MSLDELLAEIRASRLILTWSRLRGLVLWAPNKRVPAAIRQAIATHRRELARLVNESDTRVCPAQDLHRKHFAYAGRGRYICEMCARLDNAMRAA